MLPHHARTTQLSRLALVDAPSPDVWWPAERSLARQLPELVALWPAARGRVVRVLYDLLDWEDHPRRVGLVGGRSIRTDPFSERHVDGPRGAWSHRLEVLTAAGGRHQLALVPPHTEVGAARALLAAAGAAPAAGPAVAAVERPRDLGELIAQVAHERRAVSILRTRTRGRETTGDLSDARDRLVSALQQVCDELTRTGRPVSPRILSELRLYRGLGSR